MLSHFPDFFFFFKQNVKTTNLRAEQKPIFVWTRNAAASAHIVYATITKHMAKMCTIADNLLQEIVIFSKQLYELLCFEKALSVILGFKKYMLDFK